MSDEDRAKAIRLLHMKIRFTAAKLDRYRRKVAQMEADELRLTEERNARCAGKTKSIQIMDRLEV